jgi:hypothetical protein
VGGPALAGVLVFIAGFALTLEDNRRLGKDTRPKMTQCQRRA